MQWETSGKVICSILSHIFIFTRSFMLLLSRNFQSLLKGWLLLAVFLTDVSSTNKTKSSCGTSVCIECSTTAVTAYVGDDMITSDSAHVISPISFSFNGNRTLPKCQAATTATGEIKLSTKLNGECGTVVEKTFHKSKYSNSIWFYNITSDTFTFLTNVSCLYVNGTNIPSINSKTAHHITNSSGINFKVSIDVFRDASFSDSSNLQHMSFPSFQVNQPLFVEIAYDPPLPFLHRMDIERCYASYLANSKDIIYSFIDHRCPSATDEYTVEMLQNDENSFRWKFSVFSWKQVHDNTQQRFYLYCSVKTCDYNSTELCESAKNENCSSPANNSTTTTYENSNSKQFEVALGPFFIVEQVWFQQHGLKQSGKGEEEEEVQEIDKQQANVTAFDSSHFKSAAKIAGFSCGAFFLVALVAVLCVMKRRVRLVYRPTSYPTEDRIQPGFAFVLRSSNDVPLVNFNNEEATGNYNSLT